jgi:fluoroquinolone resistance protein
MVSDAFDESDEFFQQTFRNVASPQKTVQNKDFEDCRFDSCSFQEAEFSACTFRESLFVGCNLSVMKVPNSRFVDVTFQRCKVTGVNWTAAQLSAIGMALTFEEQCVLDYSVFLGLKLRNTAFRHSTAREVDFTDADLSGCDFSGTDLSGARFNRTNLSKAHLEGAFGYSIDLSANQLTGTRVSLPEAGSLLQLMGIHVVDNPTDMGARSERRPGVDPRSS